MQARIAVDANKVVGQIHPHIYGHFIEHLRECIYNGLWAELLQNRKFAGHDTKHYGVLDPWEPVGSKEAAFWMHDNRVYYVAGMSDVRGQSQRIELKAAGQPAGVAQAGLGLIGGKEYEVRLVLKAEGSVGPVEVSLGESGQAASAQIAAVGGDWQTSTLRLTAPKSTENGRFAVTFKEAGKLWVGAASLMAAGNVKGWRSDVLELARGMKPPIVRYPGGNFASNYHWQDGLGDQDRRPVRFDRAWNVFEPNDVGTDEFMEWCRMLGTEPYLCVNTGNGTVEEAAAWVEYCNGPATSKYGARRAANGHPEPYDIIYWGVGNETYGNWQVGHTDAETFAHECVAFAKAMRAVDPRVKILAVGGTPDRWPDWNAAVARIAGSEIDYITLHHYARDLKDTPLDDSYKMTVTAPLRIGELIEQSRRDIDENSGGKFIPISFDEWNVSHPRAAETERATRQNYALADGLYAAGFFNLMLRNADHITMANQAQMVNLLGLIETSQTDCYGTPEYLAYQLYVDHAGSQSLAVAVEAPKFDVPEVGNMPARQGVAYLDVAASYDPAGKSLFVHVVNLNPSESAEVTISVSGLKPRGAAKAFTMSGPDAWSKNSFADHHVVKIEARDAGAASQEFTVRVPKHSASSIQVECE